MYPCRRDAAINVRQGTNVQVKVEAEDKAGEGFVGGYAVDDEGVPASATALVENGILKTLLTSRNPVCDIERSTGNRRGGGPAPSNLVVTARRGMTRDEKEMSAVTRRGGACPRPQ